MQGLGSSSIRSELKGLTAGLRIRFPQHQLCSSDKVPEIRIGLSETRGNMGCSPLESLVNHLELASDELMVCGDRDVCDIWELLIVDQISACVVN